MDKCPFEAFNHVSVCTLREELGVPEEIMWKRFQDVYSSTSTMRAPFDANRLMRRGVGHAAKSGKFVLSVLKKMLPRRSEQRGARRNGLVDTDPDSDGVETLNATEVVASDEEDEEVKEDTGVKSADVDEEAAIQRELERQREEKEAALRSLEENGPDIAGESSDSSTIDSSSSDR